MQQWSPKTGGLLEVCLEVGGNLVYMGFSTCNYYSVWQHLIYHRSHNNCPNRGSVRGLFEGLSGVCFNLFYMRFHHIKIIAYRIPM